MVEMSLRTKPTEPEECRLRANRVGEKVSERRGCTLSPFPNTAYMFIFYFNNLAW